MTLKEELAKQASNFRAYKPDLLGAWLMQEFVVRNGTEFKGKAKPSRYKPGWPKQCFDNTAKLVKRSGKLRYFEGFAWEKDITWPFHHAWAVNAKNEVIDVTLRRPRDYSYIGVHFPPDVYDSRAKTSTSVLDTQMGIAYKLMLKLDPSLRELISTDVLERFEK